MRTRERRRRALRIAAALIDAMDLERFYGEETHMRELGRAEDLEEDKRWIATLLRREAA